MQYINALLKVSKDFPDEIIEATLTAYISKKIGQQFSYQQEFSHYESKVDLHLINEFEKLDLPLDIELFIEFFESLLEKDNVTENGIVFTLRVWVKKEDYWTVNFDINEDIDKVFKHEGIKIPYRQIDIHMDAQDEE